MREMRDEVSLRAVLVGLAIGAVLAIGNVYIGLKTSWWDSGNVTAAVLGFALLAPGKRIGRRPYTLLENNITQNHGRGGGHHAARPGPAGSASSAGAAGTSLPGLGRRHLGAGAGGVRDPAGRSPAPALQSLAEPLPVSPARWPPPRSSAPSTLRRTRPAGRRAR
jgi:hypothetical protein